MEEFFDTAFRLKEILEEGRPEEKQRILLKVGQNFLVSDKKLSFSFKKPYDLLLKPELRTNLLASTDEIRTFWQYSQERFYVPNYYIPA